MLQAFVEQRLHAVGLDEPDLAGVRIGGVDPARLVVVMQVALRPSTVTARPSARESERSVRRDRRFIADPSHPDRA